VTDASPRAGGSQTPGATSSDTQRSRQPAGARGRGPRRFDYVVVGHVTCDIVERGRGGTVRQPGGTAFYSAVQAARLGLRTQIVTQGVPEEIESLIAPYGVELELQVIRAPRTTTLRTAGFGASREQRLLAWAGPIQTPFELDATILHLAPVAREVPSEWRGRADFVGLTPQGLVRDWRTRLDATAECCAPATEVVPVELDRALLPRRFDAAVISEQERSSCEALFASACALGACVAVTAGSLPATVHLAARTGSRTVSSQAPPSVAVRDDLGAGDVFAAAFFVALAEGRGPRAAADFGNRAAAKRIAGYGADAIGRREEITR
jgi:sugar/nucleoside kinase (ribokinase family)